MGIIANKLQHILKFDLPRSTKEAIDRNKVKIVSWNRAQLLKGKDVNDDDMPKYHEITLKIKPAALIPSNLSYNLRNTGALYSQMVVNASLTAMEITSTDPKKFAKLQHEGPNTGIKVEEKDAFGLTIEDQERLKREILLPYYQLRLKR